LHEYVTVVKQVFVTAVLTKKRFALPEQYANTTTTGSVLT